MNKNKFIKFVPIFVLCLGLCVPILVHNFKPKEVYAETSNQKVFIESSSEVVNISNLYLDFSYSNLDLYNLNFNYDISFTTPLYSRNYSNIRVNNSRLYFDGDIAYYNTWVNGNYRIIHINSTISYSDIPNLIDLALSQGYVYYYPPTYSLVYSTSYGNTPNGKSFSYEGYYLQDDDLPILNANGFTFDSWYLDSNYINRAVVGTFIDDNTTLYARWLVDDTDFSFTDVFNVLLDTELFPNFKISYLILVGIGAVIFKFILRAVF